MLRGIAANLGVFASVITACGVMYDVGAMHYLGLSMFTMFTISDHMLFVAQSIPFLLVVLMSIAAAYFLLFGIFVQLGGKQYFVAVWAIKNESSKGNIVLFTIMLCVLFAGPYLVKYLADEGATFANIGLLVVAYSIASILVVAWLSLSLESFRRWCLVASFLGVLFICYFFGFTRTSSMLDVCNSDHILTTDQGEVVALVVRAGEKGLLAVNHSNRTLLFFPWPVVRSITKSGVCASS